MKNILVIDDDDGIAEALTAILEFGGYKVSSIRSFDGLINKLELFTPDLILLDLLLSGKDGVAIAGLIRKREKFEKVPIIMLSAHPQAASAAKRARVDDFLPKPFEMNELLSKINRCLK